MIAVEAAHIALGQSFNVHQCGMPIVLDRIRVIGLRKGSDGDLRRVHAVSIGVRPGMEVWFEFSAPNRWKTMYEGLSDSGLHFEETLISSQWAPFYEFSRVLDDTKDAE